MPGVSVMNILVLVLLSVVLGVSTYTDLRFKKIFNYVTIPAIAIIILIRLFHHPQGLIFYAWGIVPAVLLLIASLITKGKAFGGGDILLTLFVGLTVGVVGTSVALVYCFVLSALFTLVAYVFAKKKFKELPMAPFLLVGVFAFYTQPYWLVPLFFG